MPFKFKYSKKSLDKLQGAHPDLRDCFLDLIKESPYDIGILEVTRTQEGQRSRVEAGASGTMNSRHIPGDDGYSYAVDYSVYYINGGISWDHEKYRKVTQCLVEIAIRRGVQLTFGALWENISSKIKGPDGPHVELNRKYYP